MPEHETLYPNEIRRQIIEHLEVCRSSNDKLEREMAYLDAVYKAIDLPSRDIEYNLIDSVHLNSKDYKAQVQKIIEQIQEEIKYYD